MHRFVTYICICNHHSLPWGSHLHILVCMYLFAYTIFYTQACGLVKRIWMMMFVVTFTASHAILYRTILTVDVVNVHLIVPTVPFFLRNLQSNRKLSPSVSFSESPILLISTICNQYRIEPLLTINIHERIERQISHIWLMCFPNSTHNVRLNTSPYIPKEREMQIWAIFRILSDTIPSNTFQIGRFPFPPLLDRFSEFNPPRKNPPTWFRKNDPTPPGTFRRKKPL